MNHRHLLPNEIDMLLDEEVGFGVAPLKAHVLACSDCRNRVEEARSVFDALERAPHFAPSYQFANRIMAEVPIFVPWHAAALDTVRRWTPRSRPARAAALALGSFVALVLTAGVIWITTQADTVVFAAGVFGTRLREAVAGGMQQLAMEIFGHRFFAALAQAGTVGVVLGGVGLLAVLASVLYGMRAAAAVSMRRRV